MRLSNDDQPYRLSSDEILRDGFTDDDLKRQLFGIDVPIRDEYTAPADDTPTPEPEPDPDAHLSHEERLQRIFDRKYQEMMEGYEREHYL